MPPVSGPQRRDFETAGADFEKALSVPPTTRPSSTTFARVHIEKVAWKMAEEFIRKALKVNPAFQEGQLMLNYISGPPKGIEANKVGSYDARSHPGPVGYHFPRSFSAAAYPESNGELAKR